MLTACAITMLLAHGALAENRKLGADELRALIDSNYMAAGVMEYGWGFMIVNNRGGKRDVFTHDFFGTSKTRTEQATVKGDRICASRENSAQEVCHDVYHVGGEHYEGWRDGKRTSTWHLFRPN